MADAKTPTRPPPSRRPKRDPREESTPPPAQDLASLPPARPEPVPRRPQKSASPPRTDPHEALVQLAALEEEAQHLRRVDGRLVLVARSGGDLEIRRY